MFQVISQVNCKGYALILLDRIQNIQYVLYLKEEVCVCAHVQSCGLVIINFNCRFLLLYNPCLAAKFNTVAQQSLLCPN